MKLQKKLKNNKFSLYNSVQIDEQEDSYDVDIILDPDDSGESDFDKFDEGEHCESSSSETGNDCD